MDVRQLTRVILFWSKYSRSCAHLLEYLREHPVTFVDYVNVDSVKVREAVIEDERFRLSQLPALICIYRNGTVQKYESNSVQLWFKDIIDWYRQQEQQSRMEEKKANLPPEEKGSELQKHAGPGYEEKNPVYYPPGSSVQRNPEGAVQTTFMSPVQPTNLYDNKAGKPEDNEDMMMDDDEEEFTSSYDQIGMMNPESTEGVGSNVSSMVNSAMGKGIQGIPEMQGIPQVGKRPAHSGDSNMASLVEQAKQMAKERENEIGSLQ